MTHVCVPVHIDPEKLREMQREEYENRERAMLNVELDRLERLPLSERREGRAAWATAMTSDWPTIRERVAWLLHGHYGYGAMAEARRVLTAGHGTNYNARIGQLVAALEWGCAPSEARKAWKSVEPMLHASGYTIQSMVTEAIERGIKDWKYSEEMEAYHLADEVQD